MCVAILERQERSAEKIVSVGDEESSSNESSVLSGTKTGIILMVEIVTEPRPHKTLPARC